MVPNDAGQTDGFFIRPAFVHEPVFPEEKVVVAPVDKDSIVPHSKAVHAVKQATDFKVSG